MQLRKSLDHSHSSNGSPSMALRNRLINFFNLPPRHPGPNMDFHLPRARSALNNSCNLTNLGVANYISKSSKGGSFVTAQNVWLHFVRMNDFIYLDNKGNPFPARVHGHVYNPLGLSAPSLSLLFPAQPSPAQLPAAPLPPHGRRSGPAMRKLRHGLQTHRVSQSNRLHPNLRITQNCYMFDTCNQF